MNEKKLYCDREYFENLAKYIFLEQSFKNDETYKNKENLYKFSTGETLKQYNERLKRSNVDNYLKWGIQKYQNFIFSIEPVLKKEKEIDFLEEFLKNFDNENNNIKEFRNELLQQLLLFESCFILIDNPNDIGLYPNYESIVSDKKFPIIKLLKRQNVVNVKKKYGQLTSVLFFEEKEIAETVYEPSETYLIFYLYEKTKITRFKPTKQKNIVITNDCLGAFEKDQDFNNNLNDIPILAYNLDDCFYDVAEKQRIIYNLNSAKLETLYKQNFSPLMISGKMNKNESITAGSFIEISANAKFMPQRLMPPIQAIEEFEKQIKIEEERIIKVLFPYLLKQNFSQQTATEKLLDFSDTRTKLEKLACFLEEIENEIWKYIKEIAPYFETITAQYNKDFDLANLGNDIQLKDFIFDLQIGLEAEKILKKYFVNKYYKKIDINKIDEINAEIDKQKITDLNLENIMQLKNKENSVDNNE
jgi:hypothetical protein